MAPTRFVKLDAMPFNANSKKDRVLLKKQYIESEIDSTKPVEVVLYIRIKR